MVPILLIWSDTHSHQTQDNVRALGHQQFNTSSWLWTYAWVGPSTCPCPCVGSHPVMFWPRVLTMLWHPRAAGNFTLYPLVWTPRALTMPSLQALLLFRPGLQSWLYLYLLQGLSRLLFHKANGLLDHHPSFPSVYVLIPCSLRSVLSHYAWAWAYLLVWKERVQSTFKAITVQECIDYSLEFKRRQGWKTCYMLYYKILNSKFNMTRTHSLIHSFQHTLDKTCTCSCDG